MRATVPDVLLPDPSVVGSSDVKISECMTFDEEDGMHTSECITWEVEGSIILLSDHEDEVEVEELAHSVAYSGGLGRGWCRL